MKHVSLPSGVHATWIFFFSLMFLDILKRGDGMKNITMRRFGAYLIDLVIIGIIGTCFSYFPLLNPKEEEYEKVYQDVLTLYERFDNNELTHFMLPFFKNISVITSIEIKNDETITYAICEQIIDSKYIREINCYNIPSFMLEMLQGLNNFLEMILIKNASSNVLITSNNGFE